MLLEQEVKETYKTKINKEFNWFNQTFSNLIEEAFNNFWEKDYKIKLVSVIENNFHLFKTEELFVSRIAIKKNLNIIGRIPKTLISNLLTCLGEKEDFDLTQITELEAKILTLFNEYIYDNFKNLLSISSERYLNEPENYNLIFFVHSPDNQLGKFILTLPKDVLNIVLEETTAYPVNVEDIKKTKVEADINVGSAVMSLNELKNLTVDDIVLLDNSNLNKMKIRFNGQEVYFKVAPDPVLIMNLDDDGELNMENTTFSQDVWDNIPVELGAEFEKVKLSLGDLKQITEGLVVDIGSVYENKIILKVENKSIAVGELVIINDRYGVRIDQMLNENNQEQEVVSSQEISVQEAVDEEVLEEEFLEDDFDYSDFEIEDENI